VEGQAQAEGGRKLDAALVPNEKLVEVSSTPEGADVLLDGKKIGKTPFTIHKIDVSKAHALEIKHAGFVAQSRSIGASDAFESKGDKDVLALALKLDPEPKAEKTKPSEKPAVAVHVTKKPAVHKPEKPEVAVEKPAEKPTEAAVEKPVEKPAEKPAVDKPEKAEKPAVDKPAEKRSSTSGEGGEAGGRQTGEEREARRRQTGEEREARRRKAGEDGQAAEKPAENPAIKTPSWMKAKPDQPAEGAPANP